MAEDDIQPGSDGTPESRIEAALDRIAKVLDTPDPVAIEVAERLDVMIAGLRERLSEAGSE